MKNLQRNLAAWFAMLMLAMLTACSSLGISPADTFEKRLTSAYLTAKTVNETAGALLDTNRITPQQAQRVRNDAKTAVGMLDATAALARTDLPAAESRLTMTITVLTALQSYLAQQNGASK